MPKTGINSDDVRKKAIASRKRTSAGIASGLMLLVPVLWLS